MLDLERMGTSTTGSASKVFVPRALVTLALLGGLALSGILGVVWFWPTPAPASMISRSLEMRSSARSRESMRPCVPAAPCLAIIIDDIGRDPRALRRLLSLPLALTFSVLPHASSTPLCLAALRSRGAAVMLHLPMEPHDRRELTDEPVVLFKDRAILAPLRVAFAAVPSPVAVNNHMGSAFTEDPAAMRVVLRELSRRRTPFVDSRTTSHSVACRIAGEVGLPCLARDVFLDDPKDLATVRYRLDQAVRLARRRGRAIAIGHPFPRTLAVLARLATRDAGVRVVQLTDMMR